MPNEMLIATVRDRQVSTIGGVYKGLSIPAWAADNFGIESGMPCTLQIYKIHDGAVEFRYRIELENAETADK